MSGSQLYDDDFEDTDHSAIESYKTNEPSLESSTPTSSTSSKLSSSVSSSSASASSSVSSPSHVGCYRSEPRSSLRGAGIMNTPNRSRLLIGNPETRQVVQSSSRFSKDLQLLHASKVIQVEQLEPEERSTYNGAAHSDTVVDLSEMPPSSHVDSRGGAVRPSKTRTVLASPPCDSSSSPSSSPSSSSSSSLRTPYAGAMPVHQTLAVTLTPSHRDADDSARRLKEAKEANVLAGVREAPSPSLVQIGGDPGDVPVWKANISPRGGSVENTTTTRVERIIIAPKSPINCFTNSPGSSSLTCNTRGTSQQRRQSARQNERGHRRGDLGSSPASCKEVQGKIAEVKNKIKDVQRAIQALESTTTPSTQRSRRGRNSANKVSLEYLSRENKHLQYQISMRENAQLNIDLLIRMAEAELKYMKERLQEVKQTRRALLAEERRAKLMFTQMSKLQPTPVEQHDRQVREGLYNRANLEAKVREVKSKIANTTAASEHLVERIKLLEKRVIAGKLTDMKPEHYEELMQNIRKNDEIIKKLVSETKIPGDLAEYTPITRDGKNEDLSAVKFPGKAKMEATLQKIIRQVELKEAKIAAYSARPFEKIPNSPVNKGGANGVARRKTRHSRSQSHDVVRSRRNSPKSTKRVSSDVRLASKQALQKGGPLGPRPVRGNPPYTSTPPTLTSPDLHADKYDQQRAQEQQQQQQKQEEEDGRAEAKQQSDIFFTNIDEPVMHSSIVNDVGKCNEICVSTSKSDGSSVAASRAPVQGTEKHETQGEEASQPLVEVASFPNMQESESCGVKCIEKPSLSPRALAQRRSPANTRASGSSTIDTAESASDVIGENEKPEGEEEDVEPGVNTPVWLRGL